MYSNMSNKSIYTRLAKVDIELINKIIVLLLNNTNVSDIKPYSDKLDLYALVFNNYVDSNETLSLIKIIKLLIDKNIALEYELSQKFYKLNTFNTYIQTIITDSYIKYIAKYGIPEDGIFCSFLLAEFT
jgi:hypothetical protein